MVTFLSIEAILKTFGVSGDIRSVIPDGNTDPQIVREIFAKANVQKKLMMAVGGNLQKLARQLLPVR